MGDWLYLIIGILVVGVAVVAGLLTSGRRRTTPPEVRDRAPADVIAPPPTEADVESPVEAPAPVETPTVEKPEASASRLVRLRQRLAGSQGGLGRGLLSLLSRDRPDEDTWEAI